MKPKYNTSKLRNQTFGASLATIVVCLSGAAHASTWIGGTSTDWNDNTNWSGGGGTGGSNAVISTTPANIATISANIPATPVDILVGDGGGTNGQLIHNAGSANTGSGNWMVVGRGGGTGSYSISGTAAMTVGNVGTSGRLYVGSGGGSTGTVNVNTSGAGQLIVRNDTIIGENGGTATLNMTSGQISTGGWNFCGSGAGTHGFMNVSGGTLTNTGRFYFGENGTATVVQTGGSVLNSDEVRIGEGATGVATYTISAGTFTANNWFLLGRNGSQGTLNLSGSGSVIKNGNSPFALGNDATGGSGTFNQSGGTITTASGSPMYIGNVTGSSPGIWNISAGSATIGGQVSVGAAGIGTLNMTGGTITAPGNVVVAANGGSTGTLSLAGGTLTTGKISGGGGTDVTTFDGTQIVVNTPSTPFIENLDTATINAGGLKVDTAGSIVSATSAFGGVGGVVKSGAGTLTLSGSNSYTGNNTVNAGTLVVGIPGSGNSTVNAGSILMTAANAGTGAISLANGTILGVTAPYAAAQLIPSAVTFGTSAATTLNLNRGDVAGTNPTNSILDVTGALSVNGVVTVNVTGSKFQAAPMPLVSYNAGSRSGGGNFTLGTKPNGVVGTLVDNPNYYGPGLGLVYFDITSVALPEWDGTNVPKYVKTGDVTNGSFDVAVTDATSIVIGQKAFGAGIPAGATVTAIAGTTITLNLAATADSFAIPVTFSSGAGTNDGVWDINTTQNWVDQVTASLAVYKDPNPVLFSDRATGPTAVTLNTTVNPSDVAFSNSTLVYSLSGSGKVSGTSTLTKSGTAALSITTTNDYTGATTLGGGTTTVATLTNGGVASPLGAATSAAANLVLAGGTLNYTGATVSIDRGFTTGGLDGAITVPGGTNLTMTGPVAGGLVSSFNKQGDGSLILTNSSVTLGAGGQVNEVLAGTLKFSGPGQAVSVPGELWVGSVPAAAGHLIVDSGSLTVGSWLTLGRGNGDTGLLSTITATNSTVVCGNFSTGYDNGLPNDSDQIVTLTNSPFTTNGQTLLGESTNATTTMTIEGTSVYTANGRFLTALGTGSACTVTIKDSGALHHTADWMSVGNSNNGVCTMTVKDSGSITSSGDFNVGDTGTANGTLILQNSASVVSTGNVFIGKNGTTGTVNMSGSSTMTAPETNVGGDINSIGALNIAGTSIFTSNNRLQVGPGANSAGNVLIEGSGSLVVNSFVSVGFNGGGNMTVKDSGSFSNNDDFSVNENGSAAAVVTVQGNGTFSTGTAGGGATLYVGRNDNKVGTLNIQGTATVSAGGTGGVRLANGTGSTGTVNLDGGTLVARRVSGGNGTSTLNLNGGLLKAGTGANLDFLSGLGTATVGAAGAFIDSNGQTIAIGQILTNGGGNLTKQGTGTLQLNAINSYFGSTTVAAGTLGGTGKVAGELIVPVGSTIAPGAAGVGTFTVNDALAMGTVIGGTYACEISGATADNLVVADLLDITGATLNFSVLAAPTATSYVIATFALRSGTFIEQNVPAGFQVVYNPTNITLQLIPTPYTTWAASYGLNPLTDGAPGVDKDTDGQLNGMEFALGGSPISGSDNAKIYNLVADGSVDGDATSELLMTIAVRTGTPVFAGSPSPTATMDGATYTIQGSTTLGSFTTGVTPVAPVTGGLPAAPAGYVYRTFSLNGSNGTPTAGFLRVLVNF
ncbi:MAG: autotransporter-associated beta strand repeat-containing protein [Luteolibacter sp.]|uniref:beta strand repeat-containing protein n=1 Tax=Luteolibacter sp. TaxID=1962973 RepID=UPI003264E425